ncbi:MAG: monovalent cation/H+ antiporter subunit D family protein [Rhodospirillaceae bacterium]
MIGPLAHMPPGDLMVLALCLPVIGAFVVLGLGRWENARDAASLITACILFYVVTQLYPHVAAGSRPDIVLIDMVPGLSIRLTLEPLGMIFALIASFLWIITTLYAIGYMRGHHEENQTRFYFFFAIAIASAMGVAMSGNMLTLFVFYEMLSVSTYPLVAHHGTEDAKRSGRVYLGILLSTSIGFLLFGMIWTWTLTGTLDFVAGGIIKAEHAQGPMLGVLLALFAFGISKAALMPFHRWLPAAMVAPTPVSALLHAVAVVKAGVFSVVKVIVYIFGIDILSAEPSTDFLLYFAGFNIIAASVVALRQDNLKRRLAYSTVSQLSYVVIAAAILTPLSLIGAAVHIAAHAFGKITLFFAAGAIMVTSHKTEVSQLNGIGRRMPITMAAFTIGALSMIGLPPTGGFVSKWFILQGASAAENWFAICVVVASTILNMGYFIPIIYAAFFRTEDPPAPGGHGHDDHDDHGHGYGIKHDHGEAAWPMSVAISITATLTITMFFKPQIAVGLAKQMMGF